MILVFSTILAIVTTLFMLPLGGMLQFYVFDNNSKILEDGFDITSFSYILISLIIVVNFFTLNSFIVSIGVLYAQYELYKKIN